MPRKSKRVSSSPYARSNSKATSVPPPAPSVPSQAPQTSQAEMPSSSISQPDVASSCTTADVGTPITTVSRNSAVNIPAMGTPRMPVSADLPVSRQDQVSAISLSEQTIQGLDCRQTLDLKAQGLWDLGHTPVKPDVVESLLSEYPLINDATVLKNGFREGFRLGYKGPRVRVTSDNLLSARKNPFELQTFLDEEVEKGRIMGPFSNLPISNLRVSPVGLVPKKSGGWRMITHLSHPGGFSVNDFIDPAEATVQYSSFDKTLSVIAKLGIGTLLAKKDIKSAFRLLPVHPGDFCLLGIQHQGSYYIDKCLPMGCAMSCNLFEKFSTFIQWATARHARLNTLDHYLDDFIFMGHKDTTECLQLMLAFDGICKELGVPVAQEKTEGPTTQLTYLGLVLDTLAQQIKIPLDKVRELKTLLCDLMQRKKVTLKEMQSLAGSLAFCCKALPAGRAFSRRIYSAMCGASKPFHFIRVTRELKQDAQIWLYFLNNFNGIQSFPSSDWLSNSAMDLYTDSSSKGCGAYLNKKWAYLTWPTTWDDQVIRDMTFLELIPIVLSVCIWGVKLANKKLQIYTDNEALVSVLNAMTSKSPRVMLLIRPLVLKLLHLNLQIKASHISGKSNEIADSLSRLQWARFRQLAPNADTHPHHIPQEFWTLLHQL